MRAFDGDSHFMEPLDMFERYIDPATGKRAVKLATDPATGKRAMLCDNRPLKLRDVEEVLGLLSGYGQKEGGAQVGGFDRYRAFSAQWQDMAARTRFLDDEEIDDRADWAQPHAVRRRERLRGAVVAGAVAAGAWLVSRRLGSLATAAALLMAFARVYAGAHWPGDVVAGLAVGALIAAAGYLLLRPVLHDGVRRLERTRLRPLLRTSAAGPSPGADDRTPAAPGPGAG